MGSDPNVGCGIAILLILLYFISRFIRMGFRLYYSFGILSRLYVFDIITSLLTSPFAISSEKVFGLHWQLQCKCNDALGLSFLSQQRVPSSFPMSTSTTQISLSSLLFNLSSPFLQRLAPLCSSTFLLLRFHVD
jgi:hypothetical protein